MNRDDTRRGDNRRSRSRERKRSSAQEPHPETEPGPAPPEKERSPAAKECARIHFLRRRAPSAPRQNSAKRGGRSTRFGADDLKARGRTTPLAASAQVAPWC